VALPDRYDDGGFTGGNTDRPGLRRLMADVEAGRVDGVVVYKVDRLSQRSRRRSCSCHRCPPGGSRWRRGQRGAWHELTGRRTPADEAGKTSLAAGLPSLSG